MSTSEQILSLTSLGTRANGFRKVREKVQSVALAHQQHQRISSISASEASAHQQDRCISKIKLRAKFLSQPQQSLKKDSAPGSYQPLVNLLISPENWNSVVFALTFTLSATVTMVHVVVCDRIGICHPTNPSGLRKRKST